MSLYLPVKFTAVFGLCIKCSFQLLQGLRWLLVGATQLILQCRRRLHSQLQLPCSLPLGIQHRLRLLTNSSTPASISPHRSCCIFREMSSSLLSLATWQPTCRNFYNKCKISPRNQKFYYQPDSKVMLSMFSSEDVGLLALALTLTLTYLLDTSGYVNIPGSHSMEQFLNNPTRQSV